jgi:hypothetical protein
MLATIVQTAPAFDPDSVTPGVIGFAATAVIAIAVCLLLFDMNRRVRRVKFREEVRADIAAEQAAAADGAAQTTDAPAADAGDIAPGATSAPTDGRDQQR